MFQERVERKLDSLEKIFDDLKFDNKTLQHNPLSRNKKQVLLDIDSLRNKLNEYARAVRELPCKYEYENRGKRD